MYKKDLVGFSPVGSQMMLKKYYFRVTKVMLQLAKSKKNKM